MLLQVLVVVVCRWGEVLETDNACTPAGREGQREGCEELLPYIEVPMGRAEHLWFFLSRRFVMFYIVQIIKHKSSTKDSASPWTSATWAAIVCLTHASSQPGGSTGVDTAKCFLRFLSSFNVFRKQIRSNPNWNVYFSSYFWRSPD